MEGERYTFFVLTQRPEDFCGVKHVVPIHDPGDQEKREQRCHSRE